MVYQNRDSCGFVLSIDFQNAQLSSIEYGQSLKVSEFDSFRVSVFQSLGNQAVVF